MGWLSSRAVQRINRIHEQELVARSLEMDGRYAEAADALIAVARAYARETRMTDHVSAAVNARIRRCGALVKSGQRQQAEAEAAALEQVLAEVEGPDGPLLRDLRGHLASVEASGSASAEPEFRLAREVDARPGPAGEPVFDGEPLAESERTAVAAYLRGGEWISSSGHGEDPFISGRPRLVPNTRYTDGRWIWSESVAYFAERYGIPPEPELLTHIRDRNYNCPPVGELTRGRACNFYGDLLR